MNFRQIEYLYKKKSPYNIILKKMFWIYFMLIIISLIFNYYNLMILCIITFALMIYLMKKIVEKTLKIKINLKNKDDISKIVRNEEYNLFRDYLKKSNLYNEKSILCIIDHYRFLIKNRIVSGNLLTLLSLALPIFLSFYSSNGFNFTELSNALPYIIAFTILIFFIYSVYKNMIEIKNVLKGEDDMYERIEEIFSDIYLEVVNKSNKN